MFVFFFKQKTAYEMRISDWSSDVCSSDLTPYYLMPDDEVAQEAFAVIREAMAATDTVGISRLVLARRERAVMLQARGKGIVRWKLRSGAEVRDPQEVFGDVEEKQAEPNTATLEPKLTDDPQQPWAPALPA